MNRVDKRGGSQNPNHNRGFHPGVKSNPSFHAGDTIRRRSDRKTFTVIKVDAFGIYLEGQEGTFAASGFEAM